MSFKEGLLKARGQITFILALAVSTGIIIHLETLDTETHIQSRVAAEVARQKARAATISAPLQNAVSRALSRAKEAYGREPGAASARAEILASLSSAVQLGIIGADAGLSEARKVLESIEQKPGERSEALASALAVTAATFPSEQGQIERLLSAQ